MFEPGSARLSMLDGVDVEAPLEGVVMVLHNNNQPGVIGAVGTLLGRHGINIASFALGRSTSGAVGIVALDSDADSPALRPPSGNPGSAGCHGCARRDNHLPQLTAPKHEVRRRWYHDGVLP